ncbi:hypothetical protein G3I24_18165, partial [Micromonospora aurantiaca]|nr:hypothetical protein [Micromonospora aurantiaca]
APDGPAPEPPGAASVPTSTGGTATLVPTAPTGTHEQLRARVLTIVALLAVVVLSVGFDMNVGYLGLTAALILQLVLRLPSGDIISRIPW